MNKRIVLFFGDQQVILHTIGVATAVTGWAMKGGPGNAAEPTGRKKLTGKVTVAAGPDFYRSAFKVDKVAGHTNIWRVDPKGMGHGSIWVNGHNLGRYPEKIAVAGLYIPECWLNIRNNQFVIYDEDGRLPMTVRVIAEPTPGRIIQTLSAQTQ
ncbi:hypothetical protein [Mucilaginibacter sp.]|uniref:hypothetical protein n=1 Tax=Mucilaginibacter sp. TaxID=1882438 RepID=UPI0032659134